MVDPMPSGAGSPAASPSSPGPGGDVIELRGLRLVGVCGVLPEEQVRPQPLLVDLDVVADLTVAGRSDDLDDTLDYGAIADEVARVVGTERFALLERLAARIAEVVLADARVLRVQVAVRKLRPPVPQLLDTSGVRITRGR
jgi:FolB domain-containing protein